MILPFVLGFIGVGVVVAGLLIRQSSRRLQDRVIRTGGFTVDQIRLVRRAIIRGRFPEDPGLHEVTVAYARQGVTNLPLGFRSTPLILGGLILAMNLSYTIPGQGAVGVGLQIAYSLLAAYLIGTNVRALRGCRAVVKAAEELVASRLTDSAAKPGI